MPQDPPRTAPLRVYLLDDHAVVRHGVRTLLENEPDVRVVGEADRVATAVVEIPALAPDVAVLDGRLPDGSGIEVAQALRAAGGTTRLLVLTSYDDDQSVFAAIRAGVDGYLLKEASGTDLVDAVRRVAAGQSLLDPGVTTQVLERMRDGRSVAPPPAPQAPPRASSAPDDAPLGCLTRQERHVLDRVAQGLTNRQIAEQMFISERTVKNHVSSMLSKLGLQRRTQAAVLALQLRQDA